MKITIYTLRRTGYCAVRITVWLTALSSFDAFSNTIRYNTIGEFKVDWKTECVV